MTDLNANHCNSIDTCPAGCVSGVGNAGASCTLPQTVIDDCTAHGVADTDSDGIRDCTAAAACTFDAGMGACTATTAASTCSAQAVNGQLACTTVLSCVYATAGDVCTADASCAWDATAATCGAATAAGTCTAADGQAACTAAGTVGAAGCALPASVGLGCVTIGNAGSTAGDDCDADTTCAWDGSNSVCGAVTSASACTAEAGNGQSACTGLAGCAYTAAVTTCAYRVTGPEYVLAVCDSGTGAWRALPETVTRDTGDAAGRWRNGPGGRDTALGGCTVTEKLWDGSYIYDNCDSGSAYSVGAEFIRDCSRAVDGSECKIPCTGTAGVSLNGRRIGPDLGKVCDLDPSTDGSASCPLGCAGGVPSGHVSRGICRAAGNVWVDSQWAETSCDKGDALVHGYDTVLSTCSLPMVSLASDNCEFLGGGSELWRSCDVCFGRDEPNCVDTNFNNLGLQVSHLLIYQSPACFTDVW